MNGRAENFKVTSGTPFLFLVIICDVDFHWAILSFGDDFVGHESFFHDFYVNRISRMYGIALIVNS